jgi:homocysteine S-methyltransferase
MSTRLTLYRAGASGKITTMSKEPHSPAVCLGEGSLYERLRRDPAVTFDPHLAHGALIYDPAAREVLAAVHREYLDIGQRFGLPMEAATATWRASRRRCQAAGLDVASVNRDNARFLRRLIEGYGPGRREIRLAGQMGPDGDGYRPEEALDSAQAEAFHRPQAEALAEGGVDQVGAYTLPAFSEALGLARAMAATGVPYRVSFVVRPEGTLLDGTPLGEAIQRIDEGVDPAPASFLVNCVHPSVFHSALERTGETHPDAAARVEGLMANTSARTPEELDGLEALDTEEPGPFAAAVAGLRPAFGVTFLGGCCGTTTAHMEAIAERIVTSI